ncbi:hypothetical protein B0H12DRAFT_309230 [Mycena haematopus]|nr:hypothetical protein B0H12DRAFT_309230 [Mycena haematopus]
MLRSVAPRCAQASEPRHRRPQRSIFGSRARVSTQTKCHRRLLPRSLLVKSHSRSPSPITHLPPFLSSQTGSPSKPPASSFPKRSVPRTCTPIQQWSAAPRNFITCLPRSPRSILSSLARDAPHKRSVVFMLFKHSHVPSFLSSPTRPPP